MTQHEINFIQEACFEKVSKMLQGIVDNENELRELKKPKEAPKKVEETKEKPKKQ